MQTSDGSRAVTLSDGVWTGNGYANLQASPQLSHPESLDTSVDYAKQLAGGKTMQDVLGNNATDEQKGAMADALELLGISNRQISMYTTDALKGNADPTFPLFSGGPTQQGVAAFSALIDAGRMRAAIDRNARADLIALNGNSFTGSDHNFQDDPGESVDTNGMIDAVNRGAKQAGANNTINETERLILGGGETFFGGSQVINSKAMFPGNPVTGHVSGTYYDGGLDKGRETLGTASVELDQGTGDPSDGTSTDTTGTSEPVQPDYTPSSQTEAAKLALSGGATIQDVTLALGQDSGAVAGASSRCRCTLRERANACGGTWLSAQFKHRPGAFPLSRQGFPNTLRQANTSRLKCMEKNSQGVFLKAVTTCAQKAVFRRTLPYLSQDRSRNAPLQPSLGG